MSGYTNQTTLNRETTKEINNKGFNLPNTIRNITFHFIKVHYNKHLEDNKIIKINKDMIPDVVNELYEEKEQDRKRQIKILSTSFLPQFIKEYENLQSN